MLLQAALKAAKQRTDGRDEEVASLRTQIEVSYAKNSVVVEFFLAWTNIRCLVYFNQNLKDEAVTAVEQLQEAESETKALKSMTQRMILTQEEMVCPLQLK